MKRKIVLSGIIILAFLLRFYGLGEIPLGLHRDEVSTGYNAYSILKTGYDERGQYLPLVFQAFGDWKRPINIYLTALFIPLVGLNSLAVRLPIAIIGIATVGILYLAAFQLTRNKAIALLSSFLLAISPWHIFMSRTGLGWNVVGLFFFLLGCYLLGIAHKKLLVLVLAALSFGATLFAYASYQIITPLFLLAVLLINRKSLLSQRNILWVSIVGVIIFGYFVSIFFPVFSINASGSSFYTKSFVYEQVTIPQSEHGEAGIARLLHNKPLEWGVTFITNYIKVLSPQFLFFNSDDNPSYSLKHVGNFYFFELMFMVIGFVMIRRYIMENTWWYILLLVFLAPLPSALTQNPYSSTRSLLLAPILTVVIAIGIYWVVDQIKRAHYTLHLVAIIAVGITYALFFVRFTDEYFLHFPINRAAHWGVAQKKLAHFLLSYEDAYDEIIISRPQESFYIYLLFYKQYDPTLFRQTIQWYPPTADGFIHAKKLGKYTFRDIRYPEDLRVPNRLLTDKTTDMEVWAKNDSYLAGQDARGRVYVDIHLLDKIALPDGSPYYSIISTSSRYEPSNTTKTRITK